VAKVVSIPKDVPKCRRWLAGFGVTLSLLFIVGLAFLVLSFLGVVRPPSILSNLPWVASSPMEPEETELDQLVRENEALLADLNLLSQQLRDREVEIAALQQEVTSIRSELNQMMLKEENVAAMIPVYGSMDPQVAAAILERLPNNDVLAILTKLKKDQAAAILAALGSERASELTLAWADGE
jgi:flagellar motor switch protein FliG